MLIGKTGAGKSYLANAFAGSLYPDTEGPFITGSSFGCKLFMVFFGLNKGAKFRNLFRNGNNS